MYCLLHFFQKSFATRDEAYPARSRLSHHRTRQPNTAIANPTAVDELPLSALPDRYGVARSQIYNRINVLGIETIKRGKKAYVNASQIAQLDQIHGLIQEGKGLEEAAAIVLPNSPVRQSRETAGQYNIAFMQDSPIEPSYETTAKLELIQWLVGAIAQQQPSLNPLSRFEQLQAIADYDWRPGTKELAEILGLKSLSGSEFERYGFRFIRVGKNGAESAWKVEKI
jgi:hypothetical protein